jgi:hypothetical protein
VVTAQVLLTPFLVATYAVHPPAMHRFVGYLEETACTTYSNVIAQVGVRGRHCWPVTPADPHSVCPRHVWRRPNARACVWVLSTRRAAPLVSPFPHTRGRQTLTPGTPLHTAWNNLPAPEYAISYWRLPQDAKWVRGACPGGGGGGEAGA